MPPLYSILNLVALPSIAPLHSLPPHRTHTSSTLLCVVRGTVKSKACLPVRRPMCLQHPNRKKNDAKAVRRL